MNKFTIGNVLEHLPTVRRMHNKLSNSGGGSGGGGGGGGEDAQRAKEYFFWVEECFRKHWPHRPMIPKAELKRMMGNQEARRWLMRARDLFKAGTPVQRARKAMSDKPVRVRLPDVLDTTDKHYDAILSRLRYVRNALLVTSDEDTVLNNKHYRKSEDLMKLISLLRPWYDTQWDAASFVVEKRRLKRMAEYEHDDV